MREHLNCPNCGAPIEGSRCGYCGTVFLDFGCLELNRPMWLRLKIHETFTWVRVVMTSISIDYRPGAALYADNMIKAVSSSCEIRPEFISIDPSGESVVALSSERWAVDADAQDDLHLTL